MSGISISAAVSSHKGNRRGNNEDSFYLNGRYLSREEMDAGGQFHFDGQDPAQLYAVCDGMGGEDAGEEASLHAVEALARYQEAGGDLLNRERLKKLIQDTSNEIDTSASEMSRRSGTTLALIAIGEGKIRIAHVGDSRVYRLSGGKFELLTSDHTEVNRMVSMGVITAEEAKTHGKRHALSQYLGMPANDVLLSPGMTDRLPLNEGDRYLLCSDGLTDMVDDADIERALALGAPAQETAAGLIEQALANGGNDNVTALCVFVRGARGAAASPPPGRRILRGALISLIGLVAAGIAVTLADLLVLLSRM